MTRLSRVRLLTGFLGAALVGCASGESGPAVYPVSGKLTVNGKPASGARVSLVPVNPDETVKTLRPSGQTADDGSFAVTSFSAGDGAPAGEFKVVVSWLVPVGNPRKPVGEGDEVATREGVPVAYTNPESTPVKLTVKPDQNEPLLIDIKGR